MIAVSADVLRDDAVEIGGTDAEVVAVYGDDGERISGGGPTSGDPRSSVSQEP